MVLVSLVVDNLNFIIIHFCKCDIGWAKSYQDFNWNNDTVSKRTSSDKCIAVLKCLNAKNYCEYSQICKLVSVLFAFLDHQLQFKNQALT